MNARCMKPVLIIAGGGPSGRAIAKRCLTRWRPTLVDVEEAQLDLLESEDIEKVVGDCTSTLVLKKTPIEQAGAVVAATGSDEVNFEFCRLARERYKIKNIIALVHMVAEAEKFREADFFAITRPSSAAAIVESQLDTGRRTTIDVGLGIGEIMEVTVQSHSPVIGKTLAMLRPKSWLLAAIYRDGKLVVPHGNTEVEENDRCLLTGDPAILPGIAEYFQRGSSEFPLQFGTRYGVVDLGDSAVSMKEAKYLLKETSATGIRLLVQPKVSATTLDVATHDEDLDIQTHKLNEHWPENIVEIGDEYDIAVHLISPKGLSWFQKRGLNRKPIYHTLEKTSEPVMVARGTQPYKNILLAVSPGLGSIRVAELAVDVARKFQAKLTVVVACPAAYVAGSAFRKEAEEAVERATGIASLYGLATETEILEGNPVLQICQRAKDFDLLIAGHRRERKFTLLRPDVSHLLAARSPISTMVLPYVPEDLGRAYTRRAKKKES
jgi:Trk K+ transport system NAD-binding subunit/nucleotide-binding universal stress UspA family protein